MNDWRGRWQSMAEFLEFSGRCPQNQITKENEIPAIEIIRTPNLHQEMAAVIPVFDGV